jgi:hypothetical protein
MKQRGTKAVIAPVLLMGVGLAVLLTLGGATSSYPIHGDPAYLQNVMRRDVQDSGPGRGINPRVLQQPGAAGVVKGALVQGGLSHAASGGVWLATAAGRLRLQPVDASEGSTLTTSVAGRVARYQGGHNSKGTDIGLRPLPNGFTAYTQFRDLSVSPELSWKVDVPGDARLQPDGSGGVEVVVPAAQTAPEAMTNTSPPEEGGSSGDATDRAPGGVFAFGLSPQERIVAQLSPPRAFDSSGRRVQGSLKVSGDIVTETVGEEAREAGPLIEEFSLSAAGRLSTEWSGFGGDAPLAHSEYSFVDGRSKPDQGCIFHVRGPRGGGNDRAPVAGQEVAAMEHQCVALFETGSPEQGVASGTLPTSSHPLAANAFSLAGAGLHHSQYSASSWLQDPPGKHLNQVTANIKWHWNTQCVKRRVYRWKELNAFRPTLWRVTSEKLNKPRIECGSAFVDAWGHFKGGEIFPACGGNPVFAYQEDWVTVYPLGASSPGFTWSYDGPPTCANSAFLSEHYSLSYTQIS